MLSPLSYAIMASWSIAGVASATQVISLANFTPRIENLPSSCSAAYTAPIEGCQASDFDVASGARCSTQCVQGLIKIGDLVSARCADVDVPETSIIGVFMLGGGVPAVCPGVQVTTISSSSTQAPPSQTTTQAEASSTSESSAAEATDRASSASSAETTTAVTTSAGQATATATQPQITFDTSAAALPTTRPTTTPGAQKSNQESGGGSPFDIVASSAPSLRLSLYASSAMLGAALFIAAMV